MLRQYEALLVLWFILGVGYSLAQTPSGRLLRRSAQSPDLPALFAAQFALSHACWLLTYPIAGWLGAKLGLGVSFLVLGIIALVALALSALMWRGGDAAELAHRHDDLTAEDPHFLEGRRVSPHEHEHTFHIDDQHQRWPR